jgi:DNA-binding MarR family transcriptional regulator
MDRRSVLVQRTETGQEFLADLREAVAAATGPAPTEAAPQKAAA